MLRQVCPCVFILWLSLGVLGCTTQKESHTARTGVEQLLISSAIDQSLAKVDFTAVKNGKVFLETKYLECTDKNYIIVSLHRHLMAMNVKLVDKADEAETIVEVASGGVGTDGQELFVGIPEIPLPPPSPVAIPRLSMFTRNKLNGTAKILIVAYDAKTKKPVINAGSSLARSDQKTWNLLGTGTVQTGSVPTEIAEATGDVDFNIATVATSVKNATVNTVSLTPATPEVRSDSVKPVAAEVRSASATPLAAEVRSGSAAPALAEIRTVAFPVLTPREPASPPTGQATGSEKTPSVSSPLTPDEGK